MHICPFKHGPAIDEAVVRWTDSHQVKKWAVIMERRGKIGNTWTTWGAAGTAAVCLAASWRDRKWLPPAALGTALLVDHYVTIAIRRKFGRPGPPDSPGGTYPSGGCDRVVLFYGLIAYLLWREFSGSPQGKAWAVGTVAALTFNEAYSREYLGKHWFTDIVSGVLAALDRTPRRAISGRPHRIYNLGNHRAIALMDFIATIEKACERKAKIDFQSMQPGDVKTTFSDIEATSRELGNPFIVPHMALL